jgi:hypothetical protein
MGAARRSGLYLALLVIAFVAVALAGGCGRKAVSSAKGAAAPERFQGEAQTIPGKAIQKGDSVDCMNNLHQLRAAIEMAHDDTGAYPPALDVRWGVPLTCTATGYAYRYDPQTGKVRCPTPGHEKY